MRHTKPAKHLHPGDRMIVTSIRDGGATVVILSVKCENHSVTVHGHFKHSTVASFTSAMHEDMLVEVIE